MKVVFLQSVKRVGNFGDVKVVSDGYAVNFLFPRKYAKPATVENQKIMELKKQKGEKALLKKKAVFEKQTKKLESFVLQLSSKASAKGAGMSKKLYAQIPVKQIVEELRHRGYDIEEKQVLMKAPIKETGEHQVQIQFLPELPPVTIRVFVKESFAKK